MTVGRLEATGCCCEVTSHQVVAGGVELRRVGRRWFGSSDPLRMGHPGASELNGTWRDLIGRR